MTIRLSRLSKYGNKRTMYNGISYHSKREAEVAQELDLRVKGKDIKSWQRQVKLPLVVNGKLIKNHLVDFLIVHTDRSLEYLEVKGVETPDYKLTRKLVEALYPQVKYTVIK